MLGIETHVIEGAGIGGPHHPAGHIGDEIGKIDLACKIADSQLVEFRAGVVGRPGEAAMAGSMARRSELLIGMALGEGIAV